MKDGKHLRTNNGLHEKLIHNAFLIDCVKDLAKGEVSTPSDMNVNEPTVK